MDAKTIRVVLADDHAMIRRGIRRILEKSSTILVIGESSTGADAIRLVYELQPDILILDIEMPDMKGYQVARELRAQQAKVSIVAVSTCDEDHYIEEILQAGINAYVTKGDAPAKILELVYRVSGNYTTVAVRPD